MVATRRVKHLQGGAVGLGGHGGGLGPEALAVRGRGRWRQGLDRPQDWRRVPWEDALRACGAPGLVRKKPISQEEEKEEKEEEEEEEEKEEKLHSAKNFSNSATMQPRNPFRTICCVRTRRLNSPMLMKARDS